jgi:hypothetical protein
MSSKIRRSFIGLSLIGLIIFGCLSWVSGPGSAFLTSNRCNIKIFPKGKEDGTEIAQVLKGLGFTGIINDANRINKVKNGYRVVFFYDDKEMLVDLQKRLKSRGISSNILKDKETSKLFLQVGAVFQNKAKAEEVSKRVQDVTILKFSVEDSYKEFPYKGKVVMVENLSEKDLKKITTAMETLTDLPIETIPLEEIETDNKDTKQEKK